MSEQELPGLMEEHRSDLLMYLQHNAGWLLKYETVDDLHQGVQLRALKRGDTFRYQGREPFLAWMYMVARTYLADRNSYWSRLKSRAAQILRLTWSTAPSSYPATAWTFASRREQLSLAVQVLATLLPRDCDLVRWSSERVPLKDQAKQLGLSFDAAKRASARALERFRRAYRLASGHEPA